MKTALLITSLVFSSASLLAATTSKKSKTTTVKQSKVKDTVSVKRSSTTSVDPQPGAPYRHEILTNFTTGGFSSLKPCDGCKSTTELGVNVSYLYSLNENVQAGGEGGISYVKAYGNSNTNINALAVGAYNLSTDFKNSIFLKAGLGFYTVSSSGPGSDTDTEFGLFIGAGKRFSWLESVAFSPEGRIVKQGDLDVGFEIHLVNFSIYWN